MSFDENELHYIDEWVDKSPYITSYYGKIKHHGLGRLLLLKDFQHDYLKKRIKDQLSTWDTIWKLEKYKSDTEPTSTYSHEVADQMTGLAKSNLRLVKDMLVESLNTEIKLDWEQLKDHTAFPTTNPESALLAEIDQVPFPIEPLFKELPKEPKEEEFPIELGFLDRLFTIGAKRKKAEAQASYQNAYSRWETQVVKVEAENEALRNDYLAKLAEAETLKRSLSEQCEKQVNEWRLRYNEFNSKKNKHNEAIEQWEMDYLAGKKESIEAYYDYILHYSAYPDLISKFFKVTFNTEEDLLIVDYLLPTPEKFPKVSEVRYIPLRDVLKDYYLSDRQFSRVYNDAIYKMVLRTVYEVFETDVANNIKQLVYNGWLLGDEEEGAEPKCVISLKVTKEAFASIDLQYTDAEACFHELNGRVTDDLVLTKVVKPWVETGVTFS